MKIGLALIAPVASNAQHQVVTTSQEVAVHLAWWVIAAVLGIGWSGILLVTLMRVSGDTSSQCEVIGE